MGRKGPKPRTYNHFQVTLDKFLGSKNLWRKAIAKDGSCLFRAVAEQVLLCQTYHHRVRLQCADYISRHRDDFKEFLTIKVEEYLHRLRDGQLWGGEVELVVFSKMYRRSIVVFNQQENQVQEQIFYSPEDEAAGIRPEELVHPIFLAYSDGNHYDSVYMKKHKTSMAFCQSLLYSVLYEKVFEEPLSQASKTRLARLYDSDFQKLATDEKCDKHLAFLSKTYPVGVLEGMGQNCYSNTPLHVYQRERESIEQADRSVAASIQFQVGDKCLVPVPGEPSCLYKGEISSAIKPNGCHMVYIFDVGEQWEIPCKDITLPTPSTSAPAVRRSTGPPQAWSKVHQRIQPSTTTGLSQLRQSSDDSLPPSLLPDLPIPTPPSTASHLHISHHSHPSLPTVAPTPPATATESNQATQKPPQSLPKSSNIPKSVPTSKSGKTMQLPAGSVPVSAMAPQTSAAKGGGAEVGVATQRMTKMLGEGLPAELLGQPQRKGEEGRRVPVLVSAMVGSRPVQPSGVAVMVAPGFPAGKDTKTSSKMQKATEGDKPANLPGRVTMPDLGTSIVRNPTEMKFYPQTATPVVSVIPSGPQPTGGFAADQKVTPSLSAGISKTPAGSRGSLSTSDESASSSDESSNGHHPGHPTQSTANTAVPLAYFSSHPMARYMLPVLPEGRTPPQVPPNPPTAQVATVLERPLMHAPMLQSQPPRPPPPNQPHPAVSTTQPPHAVRPGLVRCVSPQQQQQQQQQVLFVAKEAGRDSPYLEPQLRQVRSSQPEEAWPMVGEELHSREHLQEHPSSSPSGLRPRFMFPFGMASPSNPEQAIPMLRHMQPHVPGTTNPAAAAASMQRIVPFLFTPPQPYPPAAQQQQQQQQQPQEPPEVETEERAVQNVPLCSDGVTQTEPRPQMRDKSVEAVPLLLEQGTQCTVNMKDTFAQTDFEGIEVPLLSLEEIKPPEIDYESTADVDCQIEFITCYTIQCLNIYEGLDPELVGPAKRLVEGFAGSVHTMMEEMEQRVREEIREEVMAEVREQLRDEVMAEVREELREEVREGVREEVREELGALGHKQLNVDEQNFLQLFTNVQQGLPESFQGRVVPLEEQGYPYHLPPAGYPHQEKLHLPPAGYPHQEKLHLPPAGYPHQEKLLLPAQPSGPLGAGESADSDDEIMSGQAFMKVEGREDGRNLQPHQEASVPPYPQMAPGPMMVPPGARPMVVPMPGMPHHMGWYPYMPFPMFMPPPQVGVMPHVPPHMVPGLGPQDEQDSSSQDDEPLPPHEVVRQAEESGHLDEEQEPMDMREMNRDLSGGPPGFVEKRGQEDFIDVSGIIPTVANELPIAFPSADVKTGHNQEGVAWDKTGHNQEGVAWDKTGHTQEGVAVATGILVDRAPEDGVVHQLPSPQTFELVTPRVDQFHFPPQPLPPQPLYPAQLSPSPQSPPPAENAEPTYFYTGEEMATTGSSWRVPATGQHGKDLSTPQLAPRRPGLPCRRRESNDINQIMEEQEESEETGELAPEREVLEDKEEVAPSPPTPPSSQKQGKGKFRQSGHHRNKPRDGSYHGHGGGKYHNVRSAGGSGGQQSHTNRQHSSAQNSGSLQESPPHTQSVSRQTSSANSSRSQAPPPQPQVAGPVQPKTASSQTRTHANSNASGNSSPAMTSSSAEGVKKTTPGAKSSSEGVKSSTSGGRDSTAVAKTAGGGGGKESGAGRKNADGVVKEGSTATLEKEKGDGTAATAEAKTSRQHHSRHQQKPQAFSRQREGKRSGGGNSGGYRSNRSQQQQQQQQRPQDSAAGTTSQKPRASGGSGSSGKPAKGESSSSKKPKKYSATTTSSANSQQEPTRSGGSRTLTVDTSLAEPLPSFKNLYSSSPKDERNRFCQHTQDGWPSLTYNEQEMCPLPPHTRQYSPPLTSACEQSSTPHYYPVHHSHAQCTFDSNVSHQDKRNFKNMDVYAQFFPALRDLNAAA